MKQLTKTMKTMLDALAFADAGEFLSINEKKRTLNNVLNTSDTVFRSSDNAAAEKRSSAKRSGSRSRQVALYMGNELPRELIEYAVDTCARLQHELVVLSFESKIASQKMIKPYQHLLDEAAVEMQLINLTGDPLLELKHYLGKHPEIAFLTCKDSGYLARLYLNGLQSAHSLPVPVVVVATSQEKGAMAQVPAVFETENPKAISS